MITFLTPYLPILQLWSNYIWQPYTGSFLHLNHCRIQSSLPIPNPPLPSNFSLPKWDLKQIKTNLITNNEDWIPFKSIFKTNHVHSNTEHIQHGISRNTKPKNLQETRSKIADVKHECTWPMNTENCLHPVQPQTCIHGMGESIL